MADGAPGDEAIVRIASDIRDLKQGVNEAVATMRQLKPRLEEITGSTRDMREEMGRATEQMHTFGTSLEHHLKHQMYHILIHLITEKIKEMAEGFHEAQMRGADFWQSVQEGIAKAQGLRTVTESIKEMHEALKTSKERMDDLREATEEWLRKKGVQGRIDIGGFEYDLTDRPEDVGLSEDARSRIRQVQRAKKKASDEEQETRKKIEQDEEEIRKGTVSRGEHIAAFLSGPILGPYYGL